MLCKKNVELLSFLQQQISASLTNIWIMNFNNEYSLEGLMLKLKLQYFGHLMQRTDSFEKTLMPSNHASSVVPFSSCLQSFPASESFQMSQFFASGGQRKYWSFSFNASPSNEYSGLISFRMDWLDLLAVLGTYKVGLSSI